MSVSAMVTVMENVRVVRTKNPVNVVAALATASRKG